MKVTVILSLYYSNIPFELVSLLTQIFPGQIEMKIILIEVLGQRLNMSCHPVPF